MPPHISIALPVGPQAVYKQYLPECLASIVPQLAQGDEIVLVDDQAHLAKSPEILGALREFTGFLHLYPTLWLVGCSDAWNFGVSLAKHDLVFLMGSDDRLLPGCIEAVKYAYNNMKDKAAWYNVTCEMQDGTLQNLPNNAAAVTRGLWAMTGGFPPSAFAAPDALLLSIMMVHMPDRIIQIEEGKPYYWCRQHPEQDTLRYAGPLSWETIQIRNLETERWQTPEWT